MRFLTVAQAFDEIEMTSGTLAKIDILAHLFEKTSPDLIDKIIYLMVGHPSWKDEPEIGIAEKSAIKAVSQSTGIPVAKLEEKLREIADRTKSTATDLGALVGSIKKKKKQTTLFNAGPLTVSEIYESLRKIARFTGSGSADKKMLGLRSLLDKATRIESKWIIRIVEQKFRFGIADKAILDALSITYTGDKKNRELVEKAYNICTDLGLIARILATEGLEGIKHIQIRIGVPIKMMLGQRSPNAEEVLEKLGGKCACEYKYDGIRIQAHKEKEDITLFSRNLEILTKQFPDIRAQVQNIPRDHLIIEGECVALDPKTGKFRPFQDLMHRRRKFDIEKAVEKYRVKLFLFDLLFLDGASFLEKSYSDRRHQLERLVPEGELALAEQMIASNVEEFESILESSINAGCEGVMAKALDSKYTAGARGWSWIKFKYSYQDGLTDSLDLAVVGANMGRGKRAGVYGALYGAIYDPDNDKLEICCKVASGFKDDDLDEFVKIFEPLKQSAKDQRVVDAPTIKPDVWFRPQKVIEVKGDEITLSPTYPAARDLVEQGHGLSIRFPRFMQIRVDKNVEDATTQKELIQFYDNQPSMQGKVKGRDS